MRRQNSRLQRNGSAMDIELSRQSSSTSDNNQPHIDPRFSGLQITRDNKRTSERQEIAELRRQSRLSETTSTGIEENRYDAIPEERRPPERQDSTESDGQLQLLSPIPDPANTNTQVSRDFANWIESLGNNNNQPSNQENTQEPPHMNPFSFLSSLFGGISRLSRPNQNNDANSPQQPNADQSSPAEGTTNENENSVQNALDNGMGRFPHGAIVVRTVQPGPNGSIVVRMRVISLDELLGRQPGAENNEPGQPGQEGPAGLFGALLGMLTGLQGSQERGLDKEVLNDLPLVTYDKEIFKNVDEESKSCPICLEEFEDGNEVRFLWCIHRFHKNCVDQWLDKHTNCPICKKDYSEAVKDFE